MKYVVIALLGAIISCLAYWYNYPFTLHGHDEYLKLPDVTNNVGQIFKELDSNGDGVLNATEFLALSSNYILLQRIDDTSDTKCTIYGIPDLPVQLDEQIMNIEVNFKPLSLNSLKKNISDLPREDVGSLQGLLNWKSPFKPQLGFSAKYFSVFLPSNFDIRPGLPWWVLEFKPNKYLGPLSSRRYNPPCVEEKFLLLQSLLSLFHPRPFLWTRFAPQGIAAVMRAVEEDFLDIVFRIHAEFQLNEPPDHPFWFTPSQFSGRLIINRDATVIKFFQMEVPKTLLNVDMEWYNGPTEDSMEVDIGHIPEMSLISSALSVPSSNKKGIYKDISKIKWMEEISMEEALSALELKFYPFKKVKYYNITEAFEAASVESKLVHGIVLWGNLDDQSC